MKAQNLEPGIPACPSLVRHSGETLVLWLLDTVFVDDVGDFALGIRIEQTTWL